MPALPDVARLSPLGGWVAIQLPTCPSAGVRHEKPVVGIDERRQVITDGSAIRVRVREAPDRFQNPCGAEARQCVIQGLVVPRFS